MLHHNFLHFDSLSTSFTPGEVANFPTTITIFIKCWTCLLLLVEVWLGPVTPPSAVMTFVFIYIQIFNHKLHIFLQKAGCHLSLQSLFEMPSYMFRNRICRRQITIGTLKWFFSAMYSYVFRDAGFVSARIITVGTFKRFFPSMFPDVSLYTRASFS